MAKKNIQIIGDSMALARINEGVDTAYETWLKDEYSIENLACSSNTTNCAFKISPFADIVIIQLGGADCFPRLFSNRFRKILAHFPGQLRKLLIYPLSKNRRNITRVFPKTEVNEKQFETNFNKMLSTLKDMNILPIIINISLTIQKSYNDRNYGIIENIEKYNEILYRTSIKYDCEFIDINEIMLNFPEAVHYDNHHLSSLGHWMLSEIIKKRIKKRYTDSSYVDYVEEETGTPTIAGC